MREEEIIDIVKEIKNHQIAVFEPKENIQITRNYFTEEQRNALQGLLELYNKEKAKNKKAIDFIDDENNYFEDGENWQNVLKIKHLLEEDNK